MKMPARNVPRPGRPVRGSRSGRPVMALIDLIGRRWVLRIIWELRGCPYCKQTHLVNFAKAEIESFIQQRFEILQLNIIGSREVTDFDGEKNTVPVRSAILVTSPTHAHWSKMHALLTQGSPLKVQIFKELNAAATWLGVPVDLLRLKADS